jgi:hypothetical protein
VYFHDFIFDSFLHESTIDTGYFSAYISLERATAFRFTNAYFTPRFVGIYSQQSDATMINFSGVIAAISLDVYILMLFCWCALVSLFKLIETLRPSCEKTFQWWNIGTAIMPCLNSQALALEHSNSISRCVAIVTAGIFVLLCTTYYQMLLLSRRHARQIRLPVLSERGMLSRFCF